MNPSEPPLQSAEKVPAPATTPQTEPSNDRTESTGSVSVTSPAKKEERPRQVLGMDNIGCSKGKKSEAKWTPETEAQFIQLMLEEVLNQNCVGGNFTTAQLNAIASKLNERCSPVPPYEVKLLHGDEAWRIWTQRHTKDEYLKNRTCPHYDELTTIFIGKTATGSLAAASTQLPQGRTRVRRSPAPISKNEMFSESGEGYTPDCSRLTHHRRAPSQSNDTVINSIAETRMALQQVASAQTTTERAIAELEAYTDLPVDIVMLVCKKFEVPFNRRMMSDVDDECNQYSDHEDSSEQAEHDLENSGDDNIDDCVGTEDDVADSADDDEEKVLVYAAQLDSLYEQLATLRASTSQRRPRIKRNPVASTPFTGMDWINELEQCALRDSIASALWADSGNRRA
ncbi:CheY-like two-component responsive regulatorfamily protein [Striga asiatica]|uniref:CheY-like two-component responsive regulatorfamily protein n=1 Tax=Striga asiatica TaxID=4170 RepID=A0A5A7R8Z6_STRAF|nr:CheY-like two-component responsive regulatorfamily protein [Striga asiatica]